MDRDHDAATPQPPIFIWEPGDLWAHANIEAAERHLEAADVKSGNYTAAFDAKGRRLILGTRSERRRGLLAHAEIEVVTISPDAGDPRPEEFRPILVRYLEACGKAPQDLVGLGWPELVSLAADEARQKRL
jgi:hypothetical protein